MRLRIVLVDDEPLFLSMLGRMLEQAAPEHTIAGSYRGAEQALAALADDRPDLVISDIAMQGMDGLHLLERVRELRPQALRVVLSAYPDFSYAQRALKGEVWDYLLKPPIPEQLRELLDRAVLVLTERRGHAAAGTGGSVAGNDGDGSLAAEERVLSEHQRIVRAVERYLAEHYTRPISHHELEAEFGLVGSYINKLFKKQKGCTLMDYLTKYRIDQAKELLQDYPSMLLKEVASRVGFDDPLYFSRVFRKVTGQSPTEYGKRVP